MPAPGAVAVASPAPERNAARAARCAAPPMKIRAFDPVAADNARHIFEGNALVEIVDSQYTACEGAQGLLVVTEWNQFRNPDFDRVKSLLSAPLLFDGRNLYSPDSMARRGFAYFCIGRRPNNA